MKIRRILCTVLVLCLAWAASGAQGAQLLEEGEEITLKGIVPYTWSTQGENERIDRALDGKKTSVYTHTAWQSKSTDDIPEIIFLFSNATLQTLWIRNGNQADEEAYYNNARVKSLNVTVYSEDEEEALTFKYKLQDEYDPYTVSEDMISGYQRVDLPRVFRNVIRVDLWIGGWYKGIDKTQYNVCITDIVFSSNYWPETDGDEEELFEEMNTSAPWEYGLIDDEELEEYTEYGQQPTGRPSQNEGKDEKNEVTQRPRVTATPTPAPTATPKKTKRPTATPAPTATPRRTKRPTATPVPTATPAPTPFSGEETWLMQEMAARSGPGYEYTDEGTYFKAGTQVKALSAAYDGANGIWWVQVEFTYNGELRRAYTEEYRLNLRAEMLPEETDEEEGAVLTKSVYAYRGPGYGYSLYEKRIPAGTSGTVWQADGAYAQFEYFDTETGRIRRVWVPLFALDLETANG